MKKSFLVGLLACLLAYTPAYAHHGVAVIGITGPEGPGAPLDTATALPMPEGNTFVMLRNEYAPFRKRSLANPANVDYFNFTTLAIGYGITPSLSLYFFQPYVIKSQDFVGTNSDLGDSNVMLTLGFKYDEGFMLTPPKENLDEMADWHFSVGLSSTIPVGDTKERDEQGEYFSPAMQTGFGEFSPSILLTATKQLTDNLTFVADTSYQYFFSHEYPFTTYQFGGETRVDTALTYKVYGKGKLRTDLVGELNFLNLQRDKQKNEDGRLAELEASGGSILYATGGVRIIYNRFSLGLGIKRSVARSLKEGPQQQGAEGLEDYRLITALSYSF